MIITLLKIKLYANNHQKRKKEPLGWKLILPGYTGDGSEIRQSPPWGCIKPLVNNGISTDPTSTGEFLPDFWLPSRVPHFFADKLWVVRTVFNTLTPLNLGSEPWKNNGVKPNTSRDSRKPWVKGVHPQCLAVRPWKMDGKGRRSGFLWESVTFQGRLLLNFGRVPFFRFC